MHIAAAYILLYNYGYMLGILIMLCCVVQMRINISSSLFI